MQYIKLFLLYIRIKLSSFWTIEIFLKKIRPKNPIKHIEKNSEIESILKTIQFFIIFLPFKVKCLEEAILLFYLLCKKKYYPNLIVGVACNPISSHAWVEINNIIVNIVNVNIPRYKVITRI